MIKNKQILLICLFLTVATWLSFQGVGDHGFIALDDNAYVVENTHIHKGITIEGIRWAFTTGYAANWHPLTWISHMLDIQLFGLNPGGHHVVNLLFHIANVLLLFLVLNKMTKALWKSALVAAMFALHPLHVESVAWAAERKDVLATFFWMLTLAAYGRYAESPRLKNYLAVIAFFVLGLMAKPMMVTLPFVLLLLDYWPLERFGESRFKLGDLNKQPIRTEARSPVAAHKVKRKTGNQARQEIIAPGRTANEFQWTSVRPLILEKIPLLALTALSCVVTYIVQNEGGSVSSVELVAPNIRIANTFVSYLIYIMKTIWPDNLAVFYPHPGLPPFLQVLGAALFLAAVTFAVIRTGKRVRYLPVGWLWFLGTLVPVIGIVQVGGQAVADRYMYIPSIGLFIMAAWGIPELFKERRYGKQVLAVCSALCLAGFFILTRAQVGYWRDNITLFDHALSVTKNNYVIYNTRGRALSSLGNPARAMEDLDRAIEINPDYAEAYNNRGVVHNRMGNFSRGIKDFDRAIEINPKYAHAYNNRGAGFMELGNTEQAIGSYNKAIEIDPQFADALYNRGICYQISGKYREAIADYDRAIENNCPSVEEVFCSRGDAYGRLGNLTRAIEDYDRAIAINPEYAKAYFDRGFAYGQSGKHLQAIGDYDKFISIDPKYAEAYFQRGMAYGSIGRENQALGDMKTAARLGSERARDFLRKQGTAW